MLSARILFVDDVPAILEVFGDLLRMQGAEVVPAEDAQTAREFYSAGHFDLLIVDIIPGVREFIADFHSKLPAAPILVLTGAADLEKDELMMMDGASAVLHKPVGAGVLSRVITNLLHRAALAASQSA